MATYLLPAVTVSLPRRAPVCYHSGNVDPLGNPIKATEYAPSCTCPHLGQSNAYANLPACSASHRPKPASDQPHTDNPGIGYSRAEGFLWER